MRNLHHVLFLVSLAFMTIGFAKPALASGQPNPYQQAKVLSVTGDRGDPILHLQLLTGPDRGKNVTAGSRGLNSYSDITLPVYQNGQTVVTYESHIVGEPTAYSVVDHYRLPSAGLWFAVLALLAVAFAGWRGLGSLAGLLISLIVIVEFIIPQILHGHDPYLVCLMGAFVIATLGIFFAHGFSRRTLLALLGTYFALIISAVLSVLVVKMLKLNGIPNEDISYLHQQVSTLDIQGVLLGGMLIGILGILDDISVGQATAVEALLAANAKLKWRELYHRAIRIGREHIASLINTLILVYVGTSFVFVIYIASTSNQPLWVIVNSEGVMEEIVRGLVGGVALVLAVPISTLLAAYFLAKHPTHKPESSS